VTDSHRVCTVEQLAALYGPSSDLVKRKGLRRLDKHCRAIIAASPFFVIASANGDGADASPRGDAPGFVRVVDDTTLAIPDRPGNKRIDTLRNVVENPNVGLVFFVPGMNETLRVNGRGEITSDPALLSSFAVGGRVPLTVLIVRITEAYLHCGKALIRSKLWDPAVRIERARLPTLGAMLADQIAGLDPAEAEEYTDRSYRERLY
jgi:PPOX class probable FMN-dependent enzyme